MRQRIDRKSGRVGWAVVALVGLVGSMLATAGAIAEESTAETTIRPPIDINAASVDELTRLPGIGEVTAKRIVEFREQQGPFRRVEDLMKVKGIGEKSFQRLRPSITVGPPRP